MKKFTVIALLAMASLIACNKSKKPLKFGECAKASSGFYEGVKGVALASKDGKVTVLIMIGEGQTLPFEERESNLENCQ